MTGVSVKKNHHAATILKIPKQMTGVSVKRYHHAESKMHNNTRNASFYENKWKNEGKFQHFAHIAQNPKSFFFWRRATLGGGGGGAQQITNCAIYYKLKGPGAQMKNG
jgi:hypothetical protein